MDAHNTQNGFIRQLITVVASFAMIATFLPTQSLAQGVQAGPFLIDGTVPDMADQPSTTKLGNIHLAVPPMLAFTNPNGSTDLATIWLEVKRDELTNDIWLYFAWERESNSGSSVISYEFQKAPTDPACDFASIDQTEPASAEETALINACNPWANRQIDDFMIVWDFGGGSTDIVLRKFLGAGFGDALTVAAPDAYASLNTDSTRGEGAINLSATIFNGLQSCFNVANVIPGTITGNSDQADYKDTVLTDISGAVTISNGGTVKTCGPWLRSRAGVTDTPPCADAPACRSMLTSTGKGLRFS